MTSIESLTLGVARLREIDEIALLLVVAVRRPE
jgi:hypothetical protein